MKRLKTTVKSIRISEEVWKKLGNVAKAKGLSRNSLMARVLSEYCEKNSKVIVDKGEKM